MRIISLTFILVVFFAFISTAQNIDDEKVAVEYLRYPTDPLPEDIKTFSKDVSLSSLQPGQERGSIESRMSSVLTLPGYEYVDTGGDLTIKLHVSSFSVSDVRLQSENKENKDKDGKVTKWTEYYYTYSYKYPAKLTITNALTDEVVYDEYINGSLDYRSGKSDRLKNIKDAQSWRDKSLSSTRDRLLSDNLEAVSRLITKKYGYTPSKDYVSLKRVKKFKKFEYGKIDQGVDVAKLALEDLEPVEDFVTEDYKKKIMDAIALFEEELSESDLSDKNARVNEKVTSILYNNMALCYYWIDDFNKAEEAAHKAEGLKGDGWVKEVLSDIKRKRELYAANGLL